MNYSIRPARRDNAKPLIGVYAQSGTGKTMSALLLARGFVGPKGRIVMIETEGGRGESYADPAEYPEIGGYEVITMGEDFSPQNYGKAIAVANATKPDALIIDSASHEWEGAGGVLDMAAKNQADGAKAILVWQKPKIDHQRHFMTPLMQTPIPLVIVCMRAKYPMEERPKKNGSGKEWVRSEILEPKQSEDILYEMFVHFWIDADHNVHVTKCTSQSLYQVFREGKPISAETGRQLAGWAGQRREAGEPASQTSGATAGTPGTPASTPSAKEPGADAIILNGTDGKQLGTYMRWSDWLTALEQELDGADPETAQALWDANSDTFMRGSSAIKDQGSPAAKRFNDVGKLALERRAPVVPEDATADADNF